MKKLISSFLLKVLYKINGVEYKYTHQSVDETPKEEVSATLQVVEVEEVKQELPSISSEKESEKSVETKVEDKKVESKVTTPSTSSEPTITEEKKVESILNPIYPIYKPMYEEQIDTIPLSKNPAIPLFKFPEMPKLE